jgi:hypothetical protein
VNGSYFSRKEDTLYHSGFLSRDGVEEADFLSQDPQITHTACTEKSGKVVFVANDDFFTDGILRNCVHAFQVGPMIYQKIAGKVTTHFAPKTYIGRKHARTVMVVFEKKQADKSIKQDLWFLTVYGKMTLEEVARTVLIESRFAGEYDDLSILNLDGGSSVAYRSRELPALDFGKGKKLPIVFAIK